MKNNSLPSQNVILADTLDFNQLKSALEIFLNKGIKFEGIGTFWEHCIVNTARLAKILNLKGVSEESAKLTSTNKYEMRRYCKENHLNTPKFKLVHGLSIVSLKKSY